MRQMNYKKSDKEIPPIEYLQFLKEKFIYDHQNGILINNNINKPYTFKNNKVVINVRVPKLNKQFGKSARYIAWYLYTGEWRTDIISINRDVKDLRITNLGIISEHKRGRCVPIDVVCSRKECSKLFKWTEGPTNLLKVEHHYCSQSCKSIDQNTKHGECSNGVISSRYKMWIGSKERARRDDIPYTLLLEDIPEIPENCPILGIKLKSNTAQGACPTSPSLDRIVPSLGYIPGNVRIISWRANSLRNNGTADELMAVAIDATRLEQEILQRKNNYQ